MAQCSQIKVSGARTERPGLNACLEVLQPGDTITVWRLDRLGRSMPHLVALVADLLKRKIGFRSLCDGSIDTTTASGELMFNIFSSLAQFERRLIQERSKAGLAAARARGRNGGRKKEWRCLRDNCSWHTVCQQLYSVNTGGWWYIEMVE